MTLIQLEIIAICSLVAISCALPGSFLVLRGISMMSDAISHSILLGIVLSFFITKTLHSPLLFIGAVLAGIATVVLVELILATNRLKKDATIGFIFPIFFATGILLISKFTGNIHLDTDAVLLGEVAFAPFNRLYINGINLGPYALWWSGLTAILNSAIIFLYYKEFKLTSFDPQLASSLGFSNRLMHYILMIMTSITAVTAFNTAGSILVVGFMIIPPATAYLITSRLSHLLIISCILGISAASMGYISAFLLNISIAGAITTVMGLIFTAILLLSPEKGIITKLLDLNQKKIKFGNQMLLIQLLDHETQPNVTFENTISNMTLHMKWTKKFIKNILKYSIQKGHIQRKGNNLTLTPLGREIAKRFMVLT